MDTLTQENSELSINEIHSSLSNSSVELADIFWEIPRVKQLIKTDEQTKSPIEILVMMRIMGEVFAERIKRIFAEERTDIIKFHDYDENKQMAKITVSEETVKHNLNLFLKARSQLLNKISFLTEEEWDVKKCKINDIELSIRELLIPVVNREKQFIDSLKILLSLI